MRLLVLALFFFSGATALVYQLTWVRSLTLTFGASHEALGVVLAAFMGGLALGGVVFGRGSERMQRPLLVYGLLEVGIGLVALVLPWLLRAVDGIYISAAIRAEGVPWTLQWMRAAMAFGVLLIPTSLMGGTLPVLSRLMVSRSSEFGVRLSQLYGINTTGAVMGVAAAGFAMLPALGVRTTELVAVASNLAIGVLAWIADRRLRDAALPPPNRREERELPSGVGTADPWRVRALRLAFFGTAVSGMCALALEVMWMRGISVAVGTTTYSVTVMLSTFLVGIALGSWIHAVFPFSRYGVDTQFGSVLIGVGAGSVLVSQMIPKLPAIAVMFNATFSTPGSGLRVGTTLLTSFAVMLVPCILMGIAFPLAAQARASLREEFGRSVGDVLGLNTAGAIVGSITAGFFLIPHLGLQRGMLIVSAINITYGAIVLGLVSASRTTHQRAWMVPATALIAVAALALPSVLPDWDTRALATFRNNFRGNWVGADGRADWTRVLGEADVLYYREGRGSNVSVIESGQTRAILIDGKSVASDSLANMQHELLLGHLPVLMHPEPISAAVVGLGAGITLGSVLAHPSLERVVLVEIEPAVVGGARKFAHVNDDALDDPRLEVVFQDGRNYLRTTGQRFDVITADPIHPWARGASYLYTSEYYRIAAEHLTKGGVMCQWLPLYELSSENVKSVIATFSDNFPHTTLWQTAFDAVLIGSDSEIRIDSRFGERLGEPAVARQLKPVGLDDPLSFLLELTLDGPGIERFAEGARRNTDDNLYLEFSSPLSIGTPEVLTNIRALNRERAALDSVFGNVADLLPADRPVSEALADHRQAKSDTLEIQIALHQARGSGSPERHKPLIDRLSQIVERLPTYGRPRSLLSQAWIQYGLLLLRNDRTQEGVNALAKAVETMPSDPEANYYLASALTFHGKPGRALEFFEAAERSRPRYAHAYSDHGLALMKLGRHDEALQILSRAEEIRPQFADAMHHRALVLLREDRSVEAEAEFRTALRLKPTLPNLHINYAVLLTGQGRFAEAATLLEDGRALSGPNGLRIERRLAWLLATAPDATLRDGPRAVRLARRVNEATGDRIPQVIDTLAAALAENGAFEQAARLADRAARLADQQQQRDLSAQIRTRATIYRQGQPFHQP